MNKFDRVISLLILLQSRRVVKAAEVAEKFEISLRTVYRDINTLYNAGIPIMGEAGVGYSLVEGYRLPPVMFNETEALALLTGEKFIGKLTDEKTEAAYQNAMDKIRAVLGSDQQETLEIMEGSMAFTAPKPTDGTNYLQEIFDAVANHRVLRLHYQKPNDTEVSDRLIEPLGCYHNFGHWYLIAWCRLKKDYRTFKNARIQSLASTGKTFEAAHPTLHAYLEQEAANQQTHLVKLNFDKRVSPFTDNIKYSLGLVKEEPQGDRVFMTFLTPSMDQIAYQMLSFVSLVEVIFPESLKTLMRRLANELKEHYS